VVDVEERSLEVGAHAVCGEQTADSVLRRVLHPRGASMAAGAQQVGVQPHELRQRDRRDRAPLERGCLCEPATRQLDLREGVECVDVTGKRP